MTTIVRHKETGFYGNGVYRQYKCYHWTNGNIKYEAFHTVLGSAETVQDWEIWKHNVDDTKIEGPLQGAVNSEAVINALAWNI